jgi:transcriptional regulator with XRE-family HTH domain
MGRTQETLESVRARFLVRQDGTRITYYDIARGTGLDVTYVGRLFNQKRSPSVRSLEKIAGYLGCSLDRLNSIFRFQRG